MAGYKTLNLRPIEHGMSSTNPPIYLPQGYSPLTLNCKIYEKSLRRRPGTSIAKWSLGSEVYNIILFNTTAGDRYTVALTSDKVLSLIAGGTYTDLTNTALSVPVNERWSYTIVGDKLCFGNGAVPVQSWDGVGPIVADLNSALALNARYMCEYANRLFLYDVDVSGLRSAITLRWSKENDPTNWTDTTAGELDLMETSDYATGLGRVGDNLVLYQSKNFYVYSRTGVAENPIQRVADRHGVGCVAPYSIVNFEGFNAFIGANDFYMIQSDTAVPFGDAIRHFFFDIVGSTELKRVIGGSNPTRSELYWVANTSVGKYVFTYDYKRNEWNTWKMPFDASTFGVGAV